MEILYQDDRVIVCVKPAGILSTDEPGGMPSRLREALGDPTAVVKSVHRLDRNVGGVMVYARTRRAAAELSQQIENGIFHKEYRTVIHGVPPEAGATLRDHLLRDRRERKTYVVSGGTPMAKEAVLDYVTLASSDGMSLLGVRLRTGRAHQIRCQLAHRGLPIVGDRKYGIDGDGNGIALWSYMVGFMHPRTGKEMIFMREPPYIFPWDRFLSEK